MFVFGGLIRRNTEKKEVKPKTYEEKAAEFIKRVAKPVAKKFRENGERFPPIE